MKITEIPLTHEEEVQSRKYQAGALGRLQLTEQTDPLTLIRTIRAHVDEHREAIRLLGQQDEDAYADFVLEISYLWGEQFRRSYEWEWIRLSYDGENAGIALVAPDRSVSVHPALLIRDIVDQPQRSNNTALIYSMMSPEGLVHAYPNRSPGKYVGMF